MTTEPVEAGRFLPAAGLTLLGQDQGSGYTGRRFLVGLSDGQVIPLPLLLYLIMAAVAEGGVDGGWNADQVSVRVGAASGQRLTADNVRFLIESRLAPLGLLAGGDAAGLDDTARLNEAGPADEAAGVAQPYRRRRWPLVLGGTAVLVSVAAAGPIMAGTGGQGTADAQPSSASAAAAASRSQTAAWVTQQVSRTATVSCDPGMCGQLEQDGFPVARLKALPRSTRVLPGSGFVVATPAVRGQFGSRLAASAPQVIASFGAGAARVEVRMIAPGGASAVKSRLAAEQAALAAAGRQLLGNPNILATASARAALQAGQVDARLLALLSLLSDQRPVRLAGFTGAPGAGPGVPLRGADIDVTSPAARLAVIRLLDAQQSPYRPAVAADGSRSVVTLWFDAPASLDLSQS